jgi:hypothetical protein
MLSISTQMSGDWSKNQSQPTDERLTIVDSTWLLQLTDW